LSLGVFRNRVLRRIFGPKRDEIIGGWTELHNTKLHSLLTSPNINRTMKSRMITEEGYVAHMVEKISAYRVCWEN
jgi:hypothetical protein